MLPSGVRFETWSQLLLESVQPLEQGVFTCCFNIVQRPAAERRETGAEYHPTVKKTGIVDHLLA